MSNQRLNMAMLSFCQTRNAKGLWSTLEHGADPDFGNALEICLRLKAWKCALLLIKYGATCSYAHEDLAIDGPRKVIEAIRQVVESK